MVLQRHVKKDCAVLQAVGAPDGIGKGHDSIVITDAVMSSMRRWRALAAISASSSLESWE